MSSKCPERSAFAQDDSDIVQCTVQILLRKKSHSEYLSVLGNAVRSVQPVFEGGTPLQKGLLKRIFLKYPDQFIIKERDDGTCIVQLAQPEEWVKDLAFPGYFDYGQLERNMVEFMLEHERKSKEPMSLPNLGEYCRHALKTPMKGRLTQFLSDRKHIFIVPDTGRQHVFLTKGACNAVGIDCGSRLPKFPDKIPEFDGCPGEYLDLDNVAKEVYILLRSSKGILPIEEIEEEIRRSKPEDERHGASVGDGWHVGSTVYKYPHVFRRLNQYITLVDRIKPGTKSSAVLKEEEFPPLGS
ncbi:hypothetical protein M9434_002391 [Picochlorum sp. BPE23]|nr:hypothetical protein M9434_002391 [Picochlorum sp. BPE23]